MNLLRKAGSTKIGRYEIKARLFTRLSFKMYSIKSLFTKTDVTCVKFCGNRVLGGVGGKVFIFEDHKLKATIEVFNGHQIFGILPNELQTKYLVYGENHLKILNSDYHEISSFHFNSWILSAKWINSDSNIAIILMNNKVSLLSNDLKLVCTAVCAESCILYSGHLVNDIWEKLIALSGTVFGQILLWRPTENTSDNPVLVRLDGHKGVIFFIDYNHSNGLICSTSDDRSARLWRVKSVDLIKELETDKPEIFLQHTMFGHRARVFRCQVLNNVVLTTGEDSLLVVWNLTGEEVRKLEVHQGGSIWSLDYDVATDSIVTGGGDCGISLFLLNVNIVQQELIIPNEGLLKKTAIMNDGTVVTISESAALLCYDPQKSEWEEICKHRDLAKYSLLEVSRCRNFLALAGFHGSVHIYELNKQLKHLCSHIVSSKSRIFALHWLSSHTILTCESDGILHLWAITNEGLNSQAKFILPPSKERWTTSACMCNNKHISIGDRKGNIYIFVLGNTDPVQIIKKAHNYLGVTNLYFKNNVLVSLGRNSTLKTYKFSESSFALISMDKLPFSWLTSIYEQNNEQFLLAFLSNELVVWDYKRRRNLLQFECGGGHRSWDFHKICDIIKFAFIKNKCINLIQFNSNALNTKNLIEGYHFSAINSAFYLSGAHSNQKLVISGGEDTTLRVSRINHCERPELTTINVVKSHLSSVRTITGCKFKSEVESDEYLVFSGGGRAQIILWTLKVFLNDETELSEKYSHYQQLETDEAETRIMDLCSVLVDSCVVVIAATSNGTLKIFLITCDGHNYKMDLVGEVFYALKCILKLKYFRVRDQHLLLSAATDGNVVFWYLTDFINNLKNFQKAEVLNSIHIIKSIKDHASGINSIDCRLTNGDQFLLLTGGDDCKINLNFISVDVSASKLGIKILSSFNDVQSHSAQVTGVILKDNIFITTSIDQKLNIFNWKLEGNVLVCKHEQVYMCSIADIQGITCWEIESRFYVVVYGKGIEMYEIKLQNVSCN